MLLCLLNAGRVLCVLFYWLGYTSTTPALCGFPCACACTCTYARCQAYGTDINHIAQQAHTLTHTHTHTLSTKHPHTNIHTPHPTTASAIACVPQLYESRRLVSMSCFERSLPALHTFCSSHWGLKFPYEHEQVLNKKGHYAMKKKPNAESNRLKQ